MPGAEPIRSGGPLRRAGRGRRGAADRSARPAVLVPAGLRAAAHPVVLIFLLAGIFDVLAGEPLVQAAILFGVAAALVWDAVAHRQADQRTREPAGAAADPDAANPEAAGAVPWWASAWPSPRVVLAGAAYALVAGTFLPATWPATVAVVAPGAAGFAAAWRRPVPAQPPGPRPHPGGVTAWAAVFVAVGIWELVALFGQPALNVMSPDSPTISFLMEPVLASHSGRTVTLAAWLAAGWWLLRR